MSFLISYHSDIKLTDINPKLQSGANDTHSDDTGRLKAVVAEWLNSCSKDDCPDVTSRWLSSKDKKNHGISNNVTGCLLCPIDYDWDDLEYAIVHLCSSP